jgi:hypothetical protein
VHIILQGRVFVSCAALLAASGLVASTSLGGAGIHSGAQAAELTAPVALPPYSVSLFATGTAAYSNPDSVAVDSTFNRIYVGYQNATAKDGSDNKTSTVVAYTMDGKVLQTYSVPGHNDGLRMDPTTHLLWASSNEDGNPALVTIDPFSGTVTPYHFPPVPHGGGYDDLFFLNGTTFIVASNPTLDSSGVNVYPALDTIQLMFDHGLFLTPVLMGNATALDTTTNQTVTLNEVDPDSLSVDPQGDLVLVNQGGSELVFLHNLFTAQQQVTRVPLGTQVDDTVWAASTQGRLLIVDGKQNAIWQMQGTFTPGTVYTEAPDDSGVAGFVGTINLTNGTITPIAIGFVKPTGMAFIPSAHS